MNKTFKTVNLTAENQKNLIQHSKGNLASETSINTLFMMSIICAFLVSLASSSTQAESIDLDTLTAESYPITSDGTLADHSFKSQPRLFHKNYTTFESSNKSVYSITNDISISNKNMTWRNSDFDSNSDEVQKLHHKANLGSNILKVFMNNMNEFDITGPFNNDKLAFNNNSNASVNYSEFENKQNNYSHMQVSVLLWLLVSGLLGLIGMTRLRAVYASK